MESNQAVSIRECEYGKVYDAIKHDRNVCVYTYFTNPIRLEHRDTLVWDWFVSIVCGHFLLF